jgi:ADP-heptose:LPS heptosyltransferase
VAIGRPLLVILRALGLGDLLASAPALRALARAFPEHDRMLAAPAGLAPLLELITVDARPAVHAVADTAPLAPLPASLHDADVAVNLHGRGPQSHLLLLAGRPRRMIAFANDAAGIEGPRWRPGEHEVKRWCRLLARHGIAADPSELQIDAPHVRAPEIARGATVIHPGAASAARRWPAARFAAVAAAERAAGRSVLITGSAAERPRARDVARRAGLPDSAVLAGATTLLDLAAVVAHAGRLVSGDTGIAHLATAFATPSVVLFGPTPPHAWGPPADRPQHRALWAGRTGDPHADRADAGLLAITTRDVLAALARLG